MAPAKRYTLEESEDYRDSLARDFGEDAVRMATQDHNGECTVCRYDDNRCPGWHLGATGEGEE